MWLNNNDILQTFHKFNNNQFYDIDLDHFTYVYTCPYIDVFVSYFFFLKNNMYNASLQFHRETEFVLINTHLNNCFKRCNESVNLISHWLHINIL